MQRRTFETKKNYIVQCVEDCKPKECVVPENTPPPPGKASEIPMEGSIEPKNLKKCMEQNWKFLGGGGGQQNSSRGRGYFLELHI